VQRYNSLYEKLKEKKLQTNKYQPNLVHHPWIPFPLPWTLPSAGISSFLETWAGSLEEWPDSLRTRSLDSASLQLLVVSCIYHVFLVERHTNQRGVFSGECFCLSVEFSMKLKEAIYIHTCSERGEDDATIPRLPNQLPWFTCFLVELKDTIYI
jgi:hypothetical protein